MKKYILINGKKHYIHSEKREEKEVKKEVKEEKKVDEVSEVAKNIAEKLAELQKVSKKDEVKKKEITELANVKLVDRKVKLFTTAKGRDVSLKQSQVEGLSKWFKAFVRQDKAGVQNYFQKWEPLNEGTAAEGGYLVPTLLYKVIVDFKEDEAVILPRANVIDMTGMKTNELDVSGIATKPKVYWTAEKSQKSTTSVTFSQQSLTPYTVAAIVPLTNQLLEDSPFNIVSLVSKALADAVTKEEDRVFVVGTGTAQPTGIDAYTFRSTSCGGALSIDHIQDAYFGLPQAYRSKAVWIMNSRTIADIAKLKDSNNRPILLEEGIVTEPGFPALKRRPVLEQNDLASSKIFFGDLSFYWIGLKRPMNISIAKEATVAGYNLWERNMTAIRIEERIDGEVVNTKAFYELTNTGVS